MSSLSVLNERVTFGRGIPPEVNALMQEAVASAGNVDRTRELLYKAMEISPFQLEVYIALYKFCFYRGYIEESEQVVLRALEAASTKGGFAADWHMLNVQSAAWDEDDSPAHIYLYSLKALAFINLRLGNQEKAGKILDKIRELDPQDRVGASVIMSLAEGI